MSTAPSLNVSYSQTLRSITIGSGYQDDVIYDYGTTRAIRIASGAIEYVMNGGVAVSKS